jgi:hypothetical protein
MATTAPPKLTEADVLAMLRVRLTKPGNGGAAEYALLPHVRNDAGFNATRTLDAVSVSLWPSRGFSIEGYEIKCARSDWLRELAEPAKAEAAAEFCDRFWIVASGPGVVVVDELPPTWGLLVVHGKALRKVVAAPLLPNADVTRPVPRNVLVPMLRSAGAKVGVTPAEVTAALQEGMTRGHGAAEREYRQLKEDADELRDQVRRFEQAAGVSFRRWGGTDPTKVGAALRTVLADQSAADSARDRLGAIRNQLCSALEAVDRIVETTDAP